MTNVYFVSVPRKYLDGSSSIYTDCYVLSGGSVEDVGQRLRDTAIVTDEKPTIELDLPPILEAYKESINRHLEHKKYADVTIIIHSLYSPQPL